MVVGIVVIPSLQPYLLYLVMSILDDDNVYVFMYLCVCSMGMCACTLGLG